MGVKHKKAKGKRFEEQVASLIRKYWRLGEREVYRSLTSGNYRGIEFGDITWSIDIEKFKYIPLIECKSQENWNLENLITSAQNISFYNKSLINKVKQPFKKWLLQINKEYHFLKNKYTKDLGIKVYPLLLFKKRYSPIFCLCNTEILNEFLYVNYINVLPFHILITNSENELYIIADFEEMLKYEIIQKPFED